MEGQPLSPAQPYGAFTSDAMRALRALSATHDRPIVIGYHAVALNNPYQSLLYHRSWDAGVAAVPIRRPERIDELTDLARSGIDAVLHVHWTNQVLAHVESPAEAGRARASFLRLLDGVADAGGRIVWTVHNIVPHGTRFEDDEIRLQTAILERCDIVHVMAERTAEHVAPWFRIPPEKILHVPHPSYAGAYEDFVSREQARHELGLLPDELVFVVAGMIRPYKGLTDLLDAWDALDDGQPRRLVIAGGTTQEPGNAELVERAALHPSIVIHPHYIPGPELQLFMRAADVAVLPYRQTLNSGALMLALTFGLPVIVPADSALADAVDQAFARTYDGAVAGDLARVLGRAGELASPAARAAAAAAAAGQPPGELSVRFARGLRERLIPAS
jgi:glycosyltransferase involved in cell wall biosynthesis